MSAYNWYVKIKEFFKSLNLNQSKIEPYIFFKNDYQEIVYILLYVDDLIVISNSQDTLNEYKQKINQKFPSKDKGEITKCIGVDYKYDRSNKNFLSYSKSRDNTL